MQLFQVATTENKRQDHKEGVIRSNETKLSTGQCTLGIGINATARSVVPAVVPLK